MLYEISRSGTAPSRQAAKPPMQIQAWHPAVAEGAARIKRAHGQFPVSRPCTLVIAFKVQVLLVIGPPIGLEWPGVTPDAQCCKVWACYRICHVM